MYVVCVTVWVKEGQHDAFIGATEKNHRHTRDEPGNLRFDVLQLEEDPTRFVLYEAYTSVETAAAHKQTQHYNTWRDTVAEWMASPRQGVPYHGLLPETVLD